MKASLPSQRPSDFAINCIFVVLALAGLFLAPRLSLQLEPSPQTNQLTVSFSYPNASPRQVELEITSRLEGVFSGMEHLQSIRSISKPGGGDIELTFDHVDAIERTRFGVVARIRQVYPKLPKTMPFPNISFKSSFESSNDLLSYALISKESGQQFQRMAREQIAQELSSIKGIDDINIYGAAPLQWKVAYDRDRLQQLNIQAQDISKAIRQQQLTRELGTMETSLGGINTIQLTGPGGNEIDWSVLPIAKREGRILQLQDLATLSLESKEASSFYRINGLEVINLVIKADPKVNQLSLAAEVRQRMLELAAQQDRWQFILAHDSTAFLKQELQRIIACTLLALALLLAFVWLSNRSFRYMILILIVVIVNICIAFIVYYGLEIPLHLYSLIGITVSLGIVIDNSIVIVDHLRKKGRGHVFLAVLAATLTSIGAIVLIFFLDASQREALSDFALVFSVNLFISLLISLFFTPALFRSLSLARQDHSKSWKGRRRLVRFNQYYIRYIGIAKRYRILGFSLLLIFFGLPIFLLPSRLEPASKWARTYNSTLGSRYYSSRIKPIADIALGGSLRLFLNDRERFAETELQERLALHVGVQLPEGHTTAQMNQLVKRIEQHILQYEGVEQIRANISRGMKGSIIVYFTALAEKNGFPTLLKRELLRVVNKIGHADFEVYGVGPGFNNEIDGERLNQQILLQGYHYESLYREALQIEKELLQNNRVNKVYINSRPTFLASNNKEFYFNRPLSEEMVRHQISLQKMADAMNERSMSKEAALSVFTKGQQRAVRLEAQQNTSIQQWDLAHHPIATDSTSFTRLAYLTDIHSKEGDKDIIRKNQQYQLIVGYNFIGHQEIANTLHQATLVALRDRLPVGYTAKDPQQGFWNNDGQNYRILLATLLAVLMVFVIASILFNSVRQSFLAAMMIPFAFIGLFLSTHFFDFNFDQGGFAAFLLLSGLSVNAVFFITHHYNGLKEQYRSRDKVSLYVKAFQAKIIPIVLMILSTILGLLPFLLFSAEQPFWYPLAICTIGGLLFSMLGLLLWLPTFFNFKIEEQ